jgi:hypothetical protein
MLFGTIKVQIVDVEQVYFLPKAKVFRIGYNHTEESIYLIRLICL